MPVQPDNLLAEQAGIVRSVRLRCGSIETQTHGGQLTVNVMLRFNDKEYIGSAIGDNTTTGLYECVANATLDTARIFLSLSESPFRLMGIRHITNTPVPICMVLVEFVGDGSTAVLVGSVELMGREDACVQRATMDAINRKISMLYQGIAN